MQKAVQEWSGKKLEIIDDAAATSEETWLLAEAYRHTPMIVVGNTQDNRLMEALGTRYLDGSTTLAGRGPLPRANGLRAVRRGHELHRAVGVE